MFQITLWRNTQQHDAFRFGLTNTELLLVPNVAHYATSASILVLASLSTDGLILT